jgi:hypothetical protein
MTEPQNPGPQPVPEQILDRPVVMGDFNQELKKSKRGFGKVTLGLGAAVLLVASFFGGVATHAAIAKPAAASSNQNQARGNGNRQFPGGGGTGGGQNGQGTPGARGTVGTVDHVDGTDVYVKTQDGKTVKVSTSDTTRIRITQDGKVADLKAGSNVIVQGTTGSDGTVTAQTITEGQFARPGQ